MATEQNCPDILEAILATYSAKDIAYSGTRDGTGPFIEAFEVALKSGFPGCVCAFLDAGMEVDTRFVRGMTPLLLASGNGNPEVVEHLLGRGASVLECDNFCRRALDHAVISGSIPAVRLILAAGAPLVDEGRHGLYSSAMVEAAVKHNGGTDSLEIMDILHAAGANLDGRSPNGNRNPLCAAIQTGKEEAFAHLLKLGADPFAPADTCDSDIPALLRMGTAGKVQGYGAAVQEAILARQIAVPEEAEATAATRFRM